jgi:hypothetical protein
MAAPRSVRSSSHRRGPTSEIGPCGLAGQAGPRKLRDRNENRITGNGGTTFQRPLARRRRHRRRHGVRGCAEDSRQARPVRGCAAFAASGLLIARAMSMRLSPFRGPSGGAPSCGRSRHVPDPHQERKTHIAWEARRGLGRYDLAFFRASLDQDRPLLLLSGMKTLELTGVGSIGRSVELSVHGSVGTRTSKYGRGIGFSVLSRWSAMCARPLSSICIASRTCSIRAQRLGLGGCYVIVPYW